MIVSPESKNSKQRILDAAERLFSERGFEGASLRAITGEAGVNLASVNYYFRSKEELIKAVFARRLGPLNQQRLALLDVYETAARDRPPALEDVIEALIGPVLRLGQQSDVEGASLKKLIGMMFHHPGPHIQGLFVEQMREVAIRFVAAFRRALPELPVEELFWRIHFSIGAMALTLVGSPVLGLISGGRCDPSDVDTAIEKIVAYAAGGLSAPSLAGKKRKEQSRPSKAHSARRKG
jgi:AcrR family transcriptional regulator